MSMDVSRLAIGVTTTGIKEASTALGGLSRSAGTADGKVKSLTDNLAALMRTGGGVSGAIAGLSGTMNLINTAMQSAATNASALAQALAQSTQGMNSLTNASNQASGALREKSKWGGVVQTTLKAMTTAALAYVGVNFIKHSVQAADSWGMMQAKLKLAAGSMDNAKVAQRDLFEMSQQLRVPMEAQIKLFTRMAPAMRNNKKSYEETKEVVEGVALALQLNGATAGEASSVMLQFSQAMQKGYLDGAEFNAIAENGSLLMQALARETGKSTGELKKMGSQGKITRELIQQAISHNLAQWREDFNSLPVTVGGAVQRIKNAWIKAMGELSEDTGMNAGLVKALGVVEKMIPTIRDGLASAFIAVALWIDRNKEGISAWWDQAKGLLGDVWNIVTGVSSLVGKFSDANDGVNVLAFGIFMVRGAVAAIVDIVKVVAAAFVLAGADVVDFFLAPMYLAVKAVGKIGEGIGFTLGLLAKGASALGMDGVAKMLDGAAGSMANFVAGTQDLGANIAGVTTGAREMAVSWVSGKSELDKLLDSSKEINLEVQKTAKFNKDAWNKTTGPADKPPVDKDAEKAHNKAMKEANAYLKKQIELYAEWTGQLNSINLYGAAWEKLTSLQKQGIDLALAFGQAKDAEAKKVIGAAIAYNQAAQAQERAYLAKKEQIDAEEKYNKSQDEAIAKAQAEAKSLEDKIALFGKAKGAIEEYALAEAKNELRVMSSGMATDAQIAKQQALVDALQRVHDAQETLGGMEAGKELDKLLDPRRAINFGNELGNAFGKAGKAMEKLSKGMADYGKRQAKIEDIRKHAEKVKLTDSKKYAEAMEEASELELRSRLEGYADMAGAAKMFFKEGSTGYKTLEAAERAFRMFELAMALESFVEKSGLLTALTGVTVAANTAQTASTVAGASVEVGAKMAVANASAVAGVANQASGDPYSAFPRMAAMAAIMLALGLAVGSFGGAKGGASAPPEPTAAQKLGKGIGTVLGDDTAKSESISKSLDLMRDNSNIGLTYSASMLLSLRSIDTKMGGITADMARVPGLTTGKNFNANIGTTSRGTQGFGGKTTTREIEDTGLTVRGTTANLGLQQYLDVKETNTKSGYFGIGGGTSTSTSRQMQGVDGQLASSISDVFKDINDTIIAAGTSLGLSGDEMSKRLNEFVLNAEISLKGLHGDELQKALEAFFSASADQLAMYAAGSFSQFQKAGEGYFETLVRVASGVERAKDSLSKLGVSMVSLWEVTNKTGDIDAELVRESLIRKEAGTSLAQILKLLDGGMEDLIANYRELTRLRNTMQSLGMKVNDLSLDLIRGAGGISELSDAMDDYTSNFFTADEQAAMKMSQVTMEFNRLGIMLPKSRTEFKALVQELMNSGAMGQELAGRILTLSGVFNDAMEMYDETTGQRITDARDALSEAYDRESEALENTRDKMKDFADSLKEFKGNLIMGELSPLSVMEKYQTALAKYDDISTRALAGDEDAISQFQDVANTLLGLSREVNASGAGYMNDFNRVIAATDALQHYTEGQADQATTQLEAMRQQVESLISIDESTKTVAQAIVDLLAIMDGDTSTLTGQATATVDTGVIDTGTPSAPLTTAPTVESTTQTQAALNAQSNANMLTELQGLRGEVQALRNEARAAAERQVDATYDANDKAADKVVAGSKSELVSSSTWGASLVGAVRSLT